MKTSTRESRIKSENTRLRKLFADLAPNELAFVAPLLKNMAFQVVTLEDLQTEINASGTVDEYMNGAAQYGKKASATIQAYNAVFKNYLSAADKLIARLPKEKRQSALAAMMAGEDE